jgi:hypothetical protein
MALADVNDFSIERECIYEGERYSVRDNGAVFRHPPEGKRPRSNDNQWTFGKENSSNPYLHISNTRVHRIVATAFHGEPPQPTYVVDHKDTNCRNNRPENLRWLSRLENALKNPVTRKKIEYLCGSIEAFLKNPSMLNDLPGEPNFTWMRAVSPEEARNCMVRMSLWANSDKKPPRAAATNTRRSSFNDRVYTPLQKWEAGLDGEPGLDFAATPWCAQYMWCGAIYFPCCPQPPGTDPLDDYYQNLKVGEVFAYCASDDENPRLVVIDAVMRPNRSSILVMCESGDHGWSIVGIEQARRSKYFIHFNLGSYSSRDEAEKAFCLKKELADFW